MHAKIKLYAEERGIPVVGAIRMILSEFFRNKTVIMHKKEEMPDGIIDMGEGKGLVIDVEKLRDRNGVVQLPPTNLSKEDTIEWIRNHHNAKKNQ